MRNANFDQSFAGWREEARRFLREGLKPGQIRWSQELSLFESLGDLEETLSPLPLPKVPPEFLELAQDLSWARDEDRWSLMYRILFRLCHENPNLLKIAIDPDIQRAMLLQKAIRRDIHKMHAFVRFKKVTSGDEESYTAWHRPEHLILKAAAPFFARRFGDRKWSIYTPEASAHWDLQEIRYGPGLEQNEFDVKDDWDEVWKTYYRSTFNPARLNLKAMKAEMSPKYWSSMPETALIADLVRESPHRLSKMAENQNRAAEVDRRLSLPELKVQAKSCQACPLFEKGTQTVFGEGPEDARIMIVGEQPGDQEDLAGRVFVGPAGECLEQAFRNSGLVRENLYLTNAVKHFKWQARGKLRLHERASGREMHACKPWLEAEIEKVKPTVIIALGVTAGTALFGRLPHLTKERGIVREDLPYAPAVILSWHPAAILRSSTEAERRQRNEELTRDLQLARQLAEEASPRNLPAEKIQSLRKPDTNPADDFQKA